MLASTVTALAAVEYGWAITQTLGVVLVVVAFLKMSGLLPV